MVETLKLIPSAFFDVLARLIPGAAFLLTLTAIWDTSWQELVQVLFGSGISDNVAASLTLFVAGGLAIGYVLSGPAKLVQRVGETVDKRWVPIYVEFSAYVTELCILRGSPSDPQHGEKHAANAAPSEWVPHPAASDDDRSRARRNVLSSRIRLQYWRRRLRQLQKGSQPHQRLTNEQEPTFTRELDKLQRRLEKLESRRDDFCKRRSNERVSRTGYDYLRTYHPDVGAQCAKIRAEFTMHNALSAAALICIVAYSVNRVLDVSDNTDWDVWIFLVLLSVAIIEALRGWSTNVTQKSTITKFMDIRTTAPTTWGAVGTDPPPKPRSTDVQGVR